MLRVQSRPCTCYGSKCRLQYSICGQYCFESFDLCVLISSARYRGMPVNLIAMTKSQCYKFGSSYHARVLKLVKPVSFVQ